MSEMSIPMDPALRLRAHVESFRVDRPFIEGKLKRLQSQLDRASLSDRARQEFLRRSQAALSQAVTGNYTQANRELNAIAAMLEPDTQP